jgi:hypothetical protein
LCLKAALISNIPAEAETGQPDPGIYIRLGALIDLIKPMIRLVFAALEIHDPILFEPLDMG